MKLFKLSEIELGFLITLILGLAGASGSTWIETSSIKSMEFFEFLEVFLNNLPEGLAFGCFASIAILVSTRPLQRHKKPEDKEDNDA